MTTTAAAAAQASLPSAPASLPAVSAPPVAMHPLTLRFTCAAAESRFRIDNFHSSIQPALATLVAFLVLLSGSLWRRIDASGPGDEVACAAAMVPALLLLLLFSSTPKGRMPTAAHIYFDLAMAFAFAAPHLVTAARRHAQSRP